jgi:hypothetical protein
MLNYPLSRFPHGGKALFSAPSPVGEGRDGGIKKQKLLTLLLIADSHKNYHFCKMKIKLSLCFLVICFLFQTGCEKETMQIATGNVSNVLSTTANITGFINSAGEGIKKYGHCCAKSPNPTILDLKTEFGTTIGMGEFTSFLYGLEPGMKYYARAYVSSGNNVTYGNEISFATSALR